MDLGRGFLQGQGIGSATPNRSHYHPYLGRPQKSPQIHNDLSDEDGSGHRVAHTLTACCRCRQRKTRCDPTLPKCLPCERSNSICEYLDTTKGVKIRRSYVVTLQDKVRDLEARLAQYTDDEPDYPSTTEDIVRPGGMIRLKASDETPRYLGPSSGVAMTRLLMEEAKRYTTSNRISDLIPEVRARSQARMLSIQMTGPPPNNRTKSFPSVSEEPAEALPNRTTMNKLCELYITEAQTFWPILHEKDFRQDVDDVFDGDRDPYKNFVVNMVIAISLQKLEASQYAGLADSYYLAAMRHAESVIRPKDLKTLQCLVLIGHYSLLTPARTPVYYVIGLASRICQQEGLTSEQTIATGCTDAKALDLRRRLVWTVASMDFGLAWHMGRPSGLANGTDKLDVDFFTDVGDEHITSNGITPGPPNERKVIATHFLRSREIQAEVKRTLYEQKRPEPTNDLSPWHASIEKRMKEWLDGAPQLPRRNTLSRFAHAYHHMRLVLYRPSPQIPQPSARAANVCFESSKAVIELTHKLLENNSASVTWVLSLELTSSLNALLWSTSYAEIRQAHPRQEVEALVNTALMCFEKCVLRLRAPPHVSQLYTIISTACLQSYEGPRDQRPIFSIASPSPVPEAQSSPESFSQGGGGVQQQHQQQHQVPYLNPPQFGFVFDSPPESMAYTFDGNYPPPQPTFRSNSIFCNPATDSTGRRFSYFPPEGAPDDFGQATAAAAAAVAAAAAAAVSTPMPNLSSLPQGNAASPIDDHSKQMSSPPAGPMPVMHTALSPSNLALQPTNMSDASSAAPRVVPMGDHMSPSQISQLGRGASAAAYLTTTAPRNPVAQRPLPVNSSPADWFSAPAASFFPPYNLGSMSGSFFNDAMSNHLAETGALQPQQMSTGFDAHDPFAFLPGRQGSLTQSQQMEVMNVLETEGISDIEAYLNANQNMTDVRWY